MINISRMFKQLFRQHPFTGISILPFSMYYYYMLKVRHLDLRRNKLKLQNLILFPSSENNLVQIYLDASAVAKLQFLARAKPHALKSFLFERPKT